MKSNLLRKTGLALAGFAMIFAAVSCVKDGSQPCDNTIRIVYDYNMDRVDKFHVQVEFLTIFVFDSHTGLFEQEFRLEAPFGRDFEWAVPQSLYGGEYDYMVWAGLDAGSYDFPARLEKGVSSIEDLRLKVRGYDAQLVERDLEPLWHGQIADVRFDGMTDQTEVISLTRDTKTFRLVFAFVRNNEVVFPFGLDDLELSLYSANGLYDYGNSVLDQTDRHIRYAPYMSHSEDGAGFVYEVNTLRLMADRELTLVMKNLATGRELVRMPLKSYLNLLRLTEESWVREQQEYLDREDNFRILIYLNNDGGTWSSFRIVINDWVLREQAIGE